MDWQQIVLFAILGLGAGSLIAGIAIGIVLSYRGSGIINLSTGAIAMLAGYCYWMLKTGTPPWSGTPGFGEVHQPYLSTAPALIVTAVFLLAVALLVEYGIFRPLRTATPLAKLAASLGLLLVAQAFVSLAFGIGTKPQPPVLPGGTVTVFGSNVPIDRFIVPGIVLASTLVLSLVYRYTRYGLATRAASENEDGAMLIGLSPNRIALANTLLATFFAGGLGVLAASIVQLDPQALPLQVVPALTAALFARFPSFWIACLVGLAIGSLESILYYLQIQSWFPTDNGVALPGVQPLLVFLLMVVAMFVRGTNLPTRGELVEQRLPLAPRAKRLWRPALLGAAAAVVALIVFPYDFRQALITSLLATIMCLSVVVITGFVGQISVVQLALAGISGFILSHLATDHGVGFPQVMLIGACGATVLGVLIGFSALRVRGVALAVITLAAAVAIEQFVFTNSTWGGGTSSSPVPEPKLGIDLGPYGPFRGGGGDRRPQRQACRLRDQLLHRRPERRALRLQLQLGHGQPLLGADRAQPDRPRLRRRHHDGLRRDLRRPDLRRGPVPVRAREVARHLRELRAAVRGAGADRDADPEPRRRRRGHVPQAPAAQSAPGCAGRPARGGSMTDRILTTHAGSLIRPPELLELSGQDDGAAYESALADAV